MTSDEFNLKYKDYLEDGHYGLELEDEKIIEYLDNEFQELIKIPNFKYSQIKFKFNWFCFYADNLPKGKQQEVEDKIKELY